MTNFIKIKIDLPKLLKGVVYAILLCILFLVIDYFEKYPIKFSAEIDSCSNLCNKFKLLHKSPSIIISIWFLITWSFYQNFLYVKKIFLEFIFPLSIVTFTLATGTVGFHKSGFNWVDSFFSAANLLTLNASVFESLPDNGHTLNYWIENARLTGGIFLAYAFFWALFSATGRENTSRIRFWWYRLGFRIKPFYVVIGDGEKAVALALNMVNDGKKVAFLHQGFNENIESLLEETPLWYLKGNASSKVGLTKTYFHEAERVYILHESDEENFRTIQEMDEIYSNPTSEMRLNESSLWFVNMKDVRKRSLLKNSLIRQQEKIQTFYFEQNIARKLLEDHPIDGFSSDENVAQIVVFGFNKLAESIILQCLQIGHFTEKRHLQIKVYYTKSEIEKVKAFSEEHPEIFPNEAVFGRDIAADTVQYYTFFQNSSKIIDFEELPTAESSLLSSDFSLYGLISPTNRTSMYMCLDSGLDSAALLGTILHRIAWLKNQQDCTVNVYCHYNFPDVEEEKIIEQQLNELTKKQITVYCFGNYLNECTPNNIENTEIDNLAKQIALLYTKIHVNIQDENSRIQAEEALTAWNIDGIDDNWNNIKEIDRESNRQAANHAYVKFREFKKYQDPLPNVLTNFWGNALPILAELEHRRWCAEKLLLGWLPTTDIVLWQQDKNVLRNQKRHLHLVPYNELPEDERMKDYTQVMGLPYFMKKEILYSTHKF